MLKGIVVLQYNNEVDLIPTDDVERYLKIAFHIVLLIAQMANFSSPEGKHSKKVAGKRRYKARHF